VPGRGKVAGEEESIISQDLADVLTGFVDRRKRSVTIDHMLPRVIGGERQRKVAAKSVEQLTQVFCPSSDIVLGIVEVPDIQPHGRLRHQLHQSDGSSS